MLHAVRRYNPFILFCQGRCGSFFLTSLLNSHSDVFVSPEIPSENSKDQFCAIEYYKSYSGRNFVVGHKVKYKTYFDLNLSEFFYGCKFIHLKRNILNRVFSSMFGEKFGWHDAVYSPIKIDFSEFEKRLERTKNWVDSANNSLLQNLTLEVFYEDLLSDLNSETNRISDFLNIECQNLTSFTKLQRGNLEYKDLVLNYKDLKDKFHKTQWGYLFD